MYVALFTYTAVGLYVKHMGIDLSGERITKYHRASSVETLAACKAYNSVVDHRRRQKVILQPTESYTPIFLFSSLSPGGGTASITRLQLPAGAKLQGTQITIRIPGELMINIARLKI